MPTSQVLSRDLCSRWAPGQQSPSSNAWDTSLGQRESIVAALWLSKQAAGFEVPAGFLRLELGDGRRGLQASPRPGCVC